MHSRLPNRHSTQRGFSLLEMLFATMILMVGLVAVAQLVPASLLMNSRNRTDSASLVFAQRELDQFLDQQLSQINFTDALNHSCNLGDPTQPNQFIGNPVVVVGGQTLIDFSGSSLPGYSFSYNDPTDPMGTTYDVRWSVVTSVSGITITGKRILLGVRQKGGNGYVLPVTLDTMVEK